MARREALDLLRRQSVGRVGIMADGYPVAFPVNYVVDETIDGSRVVIRTAPTTAIGVYDGLASLEIDWFDLDSGRAWSVIVRGELRPLTGRKPNEDPHPFVSDARTRWMELTIVAISGRRFLADSSGFTVEWQLGPTRRDRSTAGSRGGFIAAAAESVGREAQAIRAVIAPPGSTE